MNPMISPKKFVIFAVILIVPIILIFLVGVGMGTAGWIKYAAANLSDYLPFIARNSSAGSELSSGPLIVFSSTSTTDGDAGGRTGMTNICENEDAMSHFCSMEEIELAWLERGVHFDTFSGAWVDSHQLGTIMKSYATGQDTVSHWGRNYNCGGWTSTVGWAMYIYEGGSALNWEGTDGTPIYCSEVHPVSCCK